MDALNLPYLEKARRAAWDKKNPGGTEEQYREYRRTYKGTGGGLPKVPGWLADTAEVAIPGMVLAGMGLAGASMLAPAAVPGAGAAGAGATGAGGATFGAGTTAGATVPGVGIANTALPAAAAGGTTIGSGTALLGSAALQTLSQLAKKRPKVEPKVEPEYYYIDVELPSGGRVRIPKVKNKLAMAQGRADIPVNNTGSDILNGVSQAFGAYGMLNGQPGASTAAAPSAADGFGPYSYPTPDDLYRTRLNPALTRV